MKKTRIVAGLLCLAMASTLIAGCSKGNSAGDTGTAASGTSTAALSAKAPEDWGLIRIAVNVGGTPYEVPEEDAIVEAELQKKILKDCNAKIDFDILYLPQAQAKEQLQMKVAAGERIDLASQTFDVTEGFMQPMDELLNKYGQNIKKAIPEKEWNMVKLNGKIMAIPCGLGEDKISGGLAIRKDLLDKAGLKIPTNLIELETAFAKFKEMGYLPMAAWGIDKLYLTFGGLFPGCVAQKDEDFPLYISESGNAVPDYLSSAKLEADKTFNKWVKNGWLTKEFVTLNNQTLTALVNTGKVASFTENFPGAGALNVESLMSVDKNAVLVHVPFMGLKPAIPPAAPGACMTPTTKNGEGLIKYLNWCYSDYKNFVNAAYGIEGIQRIYDWDKMTMQYPENYAQKDKKYGARSFVGMLTAEVEFGKSWNMVLAPNASDSQKARFEYSAAVYPVYAKGKWPESKKVVNDYANYREDVFIPANINTEVKTLFTEMDNRECAFILDGDMVKYQKALDNLKSEWESKYMKIYTDAYKKASGK